VTSPRRPTVGTYRQNPSTTDYHRGMDLQEKKTWITGASSGIGRALAAELARRGAVLTLSSRRPEVLDEVRGEIESGERHQVLPLDLTDTASLDRAARSLLDRWGSVDLMVHNGGISQRSLARETALDVDRRIMETDYFGAVVLTKALLPSMRERGEGRFVVVSSLVGKIGSPLRSGYSAAKHALHGFFESLRAEEHDAGIRVTMVCPGFVRTDVSVNALTGDGRPQGTMDRGQARGMSAEECSRSIADAVERERDEVLIGGKERFAVLLWRFLPSLYRRMIRRARVT